LRSQSLAGPDAFRLQKLSSPTSGHVGHSSAQKQHLINKTTSLDGYSSIFKSLPNDPFDTDWAAAIVSPTTSTSSKNNNDVNHSHENSPSKENLTRTSTNPFADNNSSILVKTFEIQM